MWRSDDLGSYNSDQEEAGTRVILHHRKATFASALPLTTQIWSVKYQYISLLNDSILILKMKNFCSWFKFLHNLSTSIAKGFTKICYVQFPERPFSGRPFSFNVCRKYPLNGTGYNNNEMISSKWRLHKSIKTINALFICLWNELYTFLGVNTHPLTAHPAIDLFWKPS